MTLRYEAIYQDLRDKIAAGIYVPGSVLPGELQLTQIYGASRPTVRHALQLLVDQGLIDRRRKRGTVVCEPKIEQGFAMRIRSFADEMQAANRIARTTVLQQEVVPAETDVARALGVSEGAAVLHLVRVRYADRLPNVLVETYVPHELYRGIEATDFERASLYVTMRKMGAPMVSAHRRLDVSLADRRIAAELGVSVGSPVFLFHTIATNSDGRIAEYSVATYRGDTNAFEFESRLE